MLEVVPLKKRTYRTIPIQQVAGPVLAAELGERCIVALDVAKTKMVVGFAKASGECVRLVRFEHPVETPLFLLLLKLLLELRVALDFALEPTGVYGDALRHQVASIGVPVHRVDAKKVHDAAELLDGVPSSHDAKACTLIAHLHAHGLSRPWVERDEFARALRNLVDERDLFTDPFERARGRLEAVVARHWPELGMEMEPDVAWPLRLLSELPSPVDAAADPTRTAELLTRATRGALRKERIERVVSGAKQSLGTPMGEGERDYVRVLALHMLDLREKTRLVDHRIAAALSKSTPVTKLVETFGAVTTAVVLAHVGNPATYSSADAFEKALGLNLKIHQSGDYDGIGSLHITKRGPARVRQYLYLAALRFIFKNDIARRWYQARAAYRSERKMKAVVALMRKLARAMVHVARGDAFDATKLFDVRRLAPSASNAPRELSTDLPAVV